MSFATMEYQSPVGPLVLVGAESGLAGVFFKNLWRRVETKYPVTLSKAPVLRIAARQLDEYFAGRRREFDLPLAPEGTPFQRAAWAALARIPFGETRTYQEQACSIGRPTATRAVGAANGLNPIAIVLPCHRVIGANGKLTGYAGGLPAKEFLLKLEKS